MEGIRGPVIAGLDTHKKEHALCLLDGLGRKVFEGLFPADERGYAAVAEAIGEPGGCIVVGVECTMTYGAGLSRHLASKGYNVVAVLNPEKRRKRRPGEDKSDLEDAERAARSAIEGKYVSTPKAGDGFEMDAIASCYIGGAATSGGVGTIIGAVVGAFIMGILNNGMSLAGYDTNVQKIVKGCVLLGAVTFDLLSKRKKR